MSKLIFSLARMCAGYCCAVLSIAATPAFAETITVPFGWATGQVRNYQLSSRTERLGDLRGGNCTLNGQLRVEVLKREGKSASLRFQLSALKRDDACKTPSLHQMLWLKLSETPLDATLEPEAGNVALPNLVAVREKIFTSLEDSPLLFGMSVDRDTRLEIAQSFRKLLFADATAVAQATGFINEFAGVIGEVYETDTTSSSTASLPSPFGGEPLPGTVSIEAKSGAKGSGEFSIKQIVRFDAKEYKAALKKMVGQAGAGKIFKSDMDALDKRNTTAGSVMMQRIEQKTGWIIEAESATTAQLGEGTQVVKVKMLYQPSLK
jgi:hypothetical protein